MSWINKLKLAVDNSDKLKEAVGKSRQALGENADKINSVIDNVTSTADSKTGGKYTDKISKLKDSAKGGVSNLAVDGTPDASAPPSPTGTVANPATPAPEPEVPDAEVVEGN
jgi:hypothetical protein